MSSQNYIPQEYICPISLELMEDPVICEDGYTYDKSSILRLNTSISPITRQYINRSNLIPNRAIKDAIERFKSGGQNTQSNIQSNVNTNTNTNINPQLVLPEYHSSEHVLISPWDDGIYTITTKTPIDYVETRVSTTIVAVLDTSGSMGESCSAGVGAESDGFTRLDLAKHSMNTIVEMLNHGDELIIIEYNSTARCIFSGVINNFNKVGAKSAIDALQANGGTNIWTGLKMAYDKILNSANTNAHIMLLTDGQASDDPLSELKRFMGFQSTSQKLKSIKLTTFGFSYDINSKCLFDISELTGGGFNFIPDASMVGTTFCNYLANILSPDITIPIITKINSSESINTNFNSLTSVQQYELVRYHCYQLLKDVCLRNSSDRIITLETRTKINKFKDWISVLSINYPSAFILNMLKDFFSPNDDSQEQITKAIQRPEWFKKWGYHYLLSLSLAHLTRQCHNFKDQGVQLYGTELSKQLQEQIYQVFSSIQPPRPSRPEQARVVRASMSAYVDRSGGCFGPDCRIRLANNMLVNLKSLNGNELVYQGEGVEGAKIKYIVQTEIYGGLKQMCKLENLVISDYHPVYDDGFGGWVFPSQLANSTEIKITHMYNIVLETGYWVEIEGFKCVTLGHGLSEFDQTNSILRHDYFGTSKVIQDLEDFSRATCLMQSVPKIIRVYDYETIRDPNTNLVCGIVPKKIVG